MPPRYAYWTILAGGLPTAFRAAEREELLPTFKRLKEKHPDAEMKYFARGKLWDSREASQVRRDTAAGGRHPGDYRRETGKSFDQERRGRDWRPGGEHRDPRQRFKDAQKDRNQERRRERFARKNRPPREKPHGDPLPAGSRPSWRDKPKGRTTGAWRGGGTAAGRKPRPQNTTGAPGERGKRPPAWRDTPREKPHGDPLRGQGRAFVLNRFARNQGTEEPRTPPRPPGPNREPRPGDVPKPMPPPRPSEPVVPPPGPPERGRDGRGRAWERRSRNPRGGRR
jgi:hypothetical protein